MKALNCKLLVTGIGGGLALSRIEHAWSKLSLSDQQMEFPTWLAAAEKAAQQDNCNYEIIDESIFLLGTTASRC